MIVFSGHRRFGRFVQPWTTSGGTPTATVTFGAVPDSSSEEYRQLYVRNRRAARDLMGQMVETALQAVKDSLAVVGGIDDPGISGGLVGPGLAAIKTLANLRDSIDSTLDQGKAKVEGWANLVALILKQAKDRWWDAFQAKVVLQGLGSWESAKANILWVWTGFKAAFEWVVSQIGRLLDYVLEAPGKVLAAASKGLIIPLVVALGLAWILKDQLPAIIGSVRR